MIFSFYCFSVYYWHAFENADFVYLVKETAVYIRHVYALMNIYPRATSPLFVMISVSSEIVKQNWRFYLYIHIHMVVLEYRRDWFAQILLVLVEVNPCHWCHLSWAADFSVASSFVVWMKDVQLVGCHVLSGHSSKV